MIEFPKALELKGLITIYPTIDDYKEGVRISAGLLKQGTPAQAVDIMIAAICIRRNLTLLTKDNDFMHIKKLRKNFRVQIEK